MLGCKVCGGDETTKFWTESEIPWSLDAEVAEGVIVETCSNAKVAKGVMVVWCVYAKYAVVIINEGWEETLRCKIVEMPSMWWWSKLKDEKKLLDTIVDYVNKRLHPTNIRQLNVWCSVIESDKKTCDYLRIPCKNYYNSNMHLN